MTALWVQILFVIIAVAVAVVVVLAAPDGPPMHRPRKGGRR